MPWRATLEVFAIFLRLGLTSFGGPVAHLAFFRNEFVLRRRWLADQAYTDLVALGQFLPGPASSQVGLGIGLLRAGYPGALAAWLGFTLPSALMLALLALGARHYSVLADAGVLHGLTLAAVSVVAQALCGMARSFCPDAFRVWLMLTVAALLLIWPLPLLQPVLLLAAGVAGLIGCSRHRPVGAGLPLPGISRRAGMIWLLVLLLLLAGLPWLAQLDPGGLPALADGFFRAGALVFGGGHVVVPLLQAELVATGRMPAETFLAGYGAAQAVPGPVFSVSAFLGASMAGWPGAATAVLAIFAPAFLWLMAALPFWVRLSGSPPVRAAMAGVNAAVVGLLLVAWLSMLTGGAVQRPLDGLVVMAGWLALQYGRWPAWVVVAACGLLGVWLA